MPIEHLGIDIAKLTFDAALLTAEGKPKHRTFSNDAAGYHALTDWLHQNQIADLAQIHACLEATGHYGDALARSLLAWGGTVSVVNPASIRAFARTELSRTKTDKADAARIARYCQMHRPPAWTPPADEVATLQALVRRLETLKQMRLMERQRLDGAPAAIHDSLQAVLSVLEEQVTAVERQIKEHLGNHPDLKRRHDLLESIPGVGTVSAATLLAELGDVSQFRSARQVAAFVGLAPRLFESGTSVRARASLCKMGRPRLRRAVYYPALSALRCNPAIRALAERLRAAGKSKMTIVGAAMRKLVHIVYGVLKTGKPFDPLWGISPATP
jgi:transposase